MARCRTPAASALGLGQRRGAVRGGKARPSLLPSRSLRGSSPSTESPPAAQMERYRVRQRGLRRLTGNLISDLSVYACTDHAHSAAA